MIPAKKYLISNFLASKRQQVDRLSRKPQKKWDPSTFYSAEEYMDVCNFILEKTKFVEKETLTTFKGERVIRKWESEYITQVIRVLDRTISCLMPKLDPYQILRHLNVFDDRKIYDTIRGGCNFDVVFPPSIIPFFFTTRAAYVFGLTHEAFFREVRRSRIHDRNVHKIIFSFLETTKIY